MFLQLRQIHPRVLRLFLLEAFDQEIYSRHETGAEEEAEDAADVADQVVEVVHVDLGLHWGGLARRVRNNAHEMR